MSSQLPDSVEAPLASPEARTTRALLAPLKELRPELSLAREAALWQQLQAQMTVGRELGRPVFGLTTRWAMLGGLAFAGVAAATWIALAPQPIPPSEVGSPQALVARPAPVLDVLTARHVLPSGAQISVDGGSVRVLEATPDATRLRVEGGGITSQVPKLAPGGQYIVETPQAVVSVHGTRFTVTRSSPTTTRIDVTEGLVSVDPPGWRPAFFLRPGEGAVVGPCPLTPAEAADSTADWRCTADGLTGLAARTPDPLDRDNLRLRAGRLVTRHAPRQGAEIWRALFTESPTGIHAEEAAFGLANALHLAGETEAARSAAADFRRHFPQSPLGEATKQY